MKKKRYSDEQIVRILGETDKDTVAEVTKRHGVRGDDFCSEQTLADSFG
tara:strand:+ start:5681 stop:5827 length:147 start_codon:yes stop_codon:yes gene_type:complete